MKLDITSKTFFGSGFSFFVALLVVVIAVVRHSLSSRLCVSVLSPSYLNSHDIYSTFLSIKMIHCDFFFIYSLVFPPRVHWLFRHRGAQMRWETFSGEPRCLCEKRCAHFHISALVNSKFMTCRRLFCDSSMSSSPIRFLFVCSLLRSLLVELKWA